MNQVVPPLAYRRPSWMRRRLRRGIAEQTEHSVEGNRLGIFHCRLVQYRAVARLLFDIFIRPRAKRDEAYRKEFILNVVLLVTIGVLAVFGVIVARNVIVQGQDYRGVPFLVFLSASVFILGLYCLSRAGFRLSASYLLVGVLFLGNALTNYHWGIDLPGILLSYGFLVVMTGILINSWAALGMTVAIAIVLNGVGYLQLRGLIPIESYWRGELFTQRDGFEFTLYFLMITAISWLSNREIEQSMRRAFRSERALMRQREQLEEDIEQRTVQLREAQLQRIDQLYRFAEFGKLASGFFHDLSNPLATLQLYLDEIEGNSHAVTHIRADAQKAQAIALHIETFTDSMKRQLRESSVEQEFSVPAEIRNVIQIMNHRILTTRTSVIFEPEYEIATYGNPLRFHQVIQNLLSNAIDAYADANAEMSRRVLVRVVCTEKNAIQIAVQDCGTGIPAAVKEKIFDPFFTTKSNDANMGIGLATTKSIIEKDFGGTIGVESSSSEGTLFTIVIPKRNV